MHRRTTDTRVRRSPSLRSRPGTAGPERRRLRRPRLPARRRSPARRAPGPRRTGRLPGAPRGASRPRGRRMTRSKGLRFIIEPRKQPSERQARLRSTKRLGGDAGRSIPPLGLVTYVFSWLRCKPTASALAAGLCSGAGVARRRAFVDQQDTMSDTSTTTANGAQFSDESPPISSVRTERGTAMSRVVQGRRFDPGRENRHTAVGCSPDVQDVQGNALYSQTNDNSVPGQGSSKYIEKNVDTLDVLDARRFTPRCPSVFASRIGCPTLDDPGRRPGPLCRPILQPANRGWSQ